MVKSTCDADVLNATSFCLPDSYTEMALAYPKQIFRIFIHDITTTRLKGIASRTSPTRSHSLSSLLSKTPISTGFGLFNRRGSGAATPTSTQSSIGLPSANLSTTSSLSTEDEEVEDQIPIVTTPEELSEEEVSMMKEKTQELNFEGHRHHGESFTPTLEPSDPLTAPAALLPSSTRSSPKLQPRQIAAGVKAVTNSLLTSTFKRSPSNSKLNGSGWGASKHSGGNISPSSPLATHSTTSVNAYPFPTVASESSTSISVSATQEGSTTDNKPDGTETDEDDKKNAIRTISRNASDSASKDIFEDGDHQHVTLQHQHHKHQHIEVQGPGQHIQSTRTRTTTFTYAYSQSFPGSTPDVTFASGSTPTHSPTPSPRIPIHGARKTGGITSGFTSTSTVDITSISLTATSLSTSPVSGPVLSPISPSVSSSSSAVKNPLVIWQERIEQCQRKLPEGMLTLFTSADELDQCQVVKSMFENYGEKSSGSGNRGDSSSERSSSPLLVSLSGGSSTSVESAHCCAEGVADRTAVNGIPVFTSSVAAD
ncbi:hypothetical protein BC939DRAFT_182974 [Gamsiella multidivaricata]|uniref:uncharacterized protein n=1 Tax=Gamsiella multidivaricata TaxID=101098 RepID=UPI00221E92D8|nr:uncharacterized protein BC939DRAFT_182974 [Gamsiella multidivaricata]KAI7822387.1 hypothetical protein BC939DRAFT_182974 [Gamsiella multidivaricata]